jgi:hypothetical protein
MSDQNIQELRTLINSICRTPMKNQLTAIRLNEGRLKIELKVERIKSNHN